MHATNPYNVTAACYISLARTLGTKTRCAERVAGSGTSHQGKARCRDRSRRQGTTRAVAVESPLPRQCSIYKRSLLFKRPFQAERWVMVGRIATKITPIQPLPPRNQVRLCKKLDGSNLEPYSVLLNSSLSGMTNGALDASPTDVGISSSSCCTACSDCYSRVRRNTPPKHLVGGRMSHSDPICGVQGEPLPCFDTSKLNVFGAEEHVLEDTSFNNRKAAINMTCEVKCAICLVPYTFPLSQAKPFRFASDAKAHICILTPRYCTVVLPTRATRSFDIQIFQATSPSLMCSHLNTCAGN